MSQRYMYVPNNEELIQKVNSMGNSLTLENLNDLNDFALERKLDSSFYCPDGSAIERELFNDFSDNVPAEGKKYVRFAMKGED